MENKYSLIPLDSEKKPYIYWKPFQYKKANIEDVFSWYNRFCEVNIGIVTGNISKLAVIDVDDLNLLPELKEYLPELKETTRVRTRRGYHYYFSLNGEYVKSTNSLFGRRLELRSNGTYVVAPPSIIKAHRYVYEIPLSEILPIPKILIKENNPAFLTKDKNHKTFRIPKYHGQKVDCIRQVLSRDLQVGERNNSLFILYNLLLRNKNTKEYAKYLVIEKNRSLSKPLNKIELKKVYRKAYKYGCSGIRDRLAYIKCEVCEYRFKDGELKDSNILIKNIRILPELSNAEAKIALMLGIVFEGENLSLRKISKKTKMNYNTVKKAVIGLKGKGII
ncbi:bifunctional DNA primase/polymerase [bacterium]|nr:bifunctional DNA primase/polymerase [bacterium]